MGKFTEVVVCMGEVDAEFVARFFREDMSSHHPTRVVFNDVCCCVYYMKIAEYMNTLGLPSYICEFTELAVRCLTKDERTIETADDLYLDRYEQLQRDSNGSGMQERGRVGLYVTLFENYMILCDHSRALEAVVRMAEEERRNRRREGESETAKNSLRRLLVQLCDDKRLAVLCNRTCSGEDNGSFWGGANQVFFSALLSLSVVIIIIVVVVVVFGPPFLLNYFSFPFFLLYEDVAQRKHRGPPLRKS